MFSKIFKNNEAKYVWSDKEPAFFSKEMQQFFKNNNVKIYHTNSYLKAVVIERFNRSLRELFIVEKIIRKNKNKYLVQWRGYSDDFNSWVDKDDIIKYT